VLHLLSLAAAAADEPPPQVPARRVRIDVDATRQLVETLLAGKVDVAPATPVRDRRPTATPISTTS
jgi:hypothetical protein